MEARGRNDSSLKSRPPMKAIWKATPHPREETAAVVRDQSGTITLIVGETPFHAGDISLRQLEVLAATDKERQTLLDAGFRIRGLRPT